jgi:hypothetical protein
MLWPKQTKQSIPRLARASLFAISGASAAPLLARPSAHDRFSATWPEHNQESRAGKWLLCMQSVGPVRSPVESDDRRGPFQLPFQMRNSLSASEAGGQAGPLALPA